MKKTLRLYSLLLIALLLLPAFPVLGEEGENLVYNGNFETYAQSADLPAGWSLTAYDEYTALAAPSDGAFGRAVTVGAEAENDVRLIQPVQVEPKSIYHISAYVRCSGVEGGQGATLSVDNYELDGTYCYSEGLFHDEEGQLDLYVKTGKQTDTLQLALRVGGYGATCMGFASFEGVTLTKIDSADVPRGAKVTDLSSTASKPAASAEKIDLSGNAITLSFLAALICGGAGIAVYLRLFRRDEGMLQLSPAWERYLPALLLGCAFLLRVWISLIFGGHKYDMGCFMAWGNAAADDLSGFYTSGMFADYPPGYMYICAAIAKTCSLLGFSYGSSGMMLLYKLPAVCADLILGYLCLRYSRKKGISPRQSVALCCVLLFQPAAAFISGAWGQIDSLLTLFLVLAWFLFTEERVIAAGAVYGLAILLKPQALMAGPLLAVAYFARIFIADRKGKAFLETVLAVISAFAVLFLLSLPMKGTQSFGWLIQKYLTTGTSYPYASVEAFNFPALLGHNWARVETTVLGLPYTFWGPLCIGLAVMGACTLYVFALRRSRKAGAEGLHRGGILALTMGLMLTLIFTFGHYMHERYIFPVLLFLLIAYILLKDRRIMAAFFGLGTALFYNTLAAMFIVEYTDLRDGFYNGLARCCGALETISALYLLWVCIDLLILGNCIRSMAAQHIKKAAAGSVSGAAHGPHAARTASKPAKGPLLPPPPARRPMSRTEKLLLLAVTAIYAVAAFLNLGTLSAPETAWESSTPGETFTVTFDGERDVEEIWVFGNLSDNGVLLITASDGTEITYEQTYDEMFRWDREDAFFTASSAELTLYSGRLNLNELAFMDEEGQPIPVTVQSTVGTQGNLFDEQDTVPDYPSYFNGMYFDELYHARTAYEHLHNLVPYENSHPPLGKLIIMIGIAIFGMNPFGWRCMGALVGVLMLPVFYHLAKRVTGSAKLSFLALGLFALDFMHYTQTRIATIDVYAVFFILLMYLFMLIYMEKDDFSTGYKKSLVPLALSGLFFGIGAACKWTCFYAGAGLAVLYFGKQIRNLLLAQKVCAEGTPEEREKVRGAFMRFVKTCLWCCLFFVVIPFMIYFASYIPYYVYEAGLDESYGMGDALSTFWRYQNFMFSYHSGLTATHPYQSSWWQWPFTLRPMWYYSGTGDLPYGMVSTLSASGNPAVWWVCTLLCFGLAALRLMGRVRPSEGLKVTAVGIGANYLPWVLITRCTFIYHFFTTVPFLILGGVLCWQALEEELPLLKKLRWVWLGAAALLFILLYPGISGLPVDASWAAFVKLLPGGGLMYGA